LAKSDGGRGVRVFELRCATQLVAGLQSVTLPNALTAVRNAYCPLRVVRLGRRLERTRWSKCPGVSACNARRNDHPGDYECQKSCVHVGCERTQIGAIQP
jgi:hypothetical protein